jgi:hypothetical protein
MFRQVGWRGHVYVHARERVVARPSPCVLEKRVLTLKYRPYMELVAALLKRKYGYIRCTCKFRSGYFMLTDPADANRLVWFHHSAASD